MRQNEGSTGPQQDERYRQEGRAGRAGPVDPVEYLIEQALILGIPPQKVVNDIIADGNGRMIRGVAEGDVDAVYEGADMLALLADFMQANHRRDEIAASDQLGVERVRLLSILVQRQAALEAWCRKARRVANLIIRLQHARPFWPGPGATRDSSTWGIIHDCMTVMFTFAFNLPGLVEGTPKDPENVFDITKSRGELERLARDASNILQGGRRDTARGHALLQVLNLLTVSLQVLDDPDDKATLRIATTLADFYGETFRDDEVLRSTYFSIQRHRAKAQFPAIAADIVWSAFQVAMRNGRARPSWPSPDFWSHKTHARQREVAHIVIARRDYRVSLGLALRRKNGHDEPVDDAGSTASGA